MKWDFLMEAANQVDLKGVVSCGKDIKSGGCSSAHKNGAGPQNL